MLGPFFSKDGSGGYGETAFFHKVRRCRAIDRLMSVLLCSMKGIFIYFEVFMGGFRAWNRDIDFFGIKVPGSMFRLFLQHVRRKWGKLRQKQ